ncbi:unnamed protein product [Urochloa humidicola]
MLHGLGLRSLISRPSPQLHYAIEAAASGVPRHIPLAPVLDNAATAMASCRRDACRQGRAERPQLTAPAIPSPPTMVVLNYGWSTKQTRPCLLHWRSAAYEVFDKILPWLQQVSGYSSCSEDFSGTSWPWSAPCRIFFLSGLLVRLAIASS